MSIAGDTQARVPGFFNQTSPTSSGSLRANGTIGSVLTVNTVSYTPTFYGQNYQSIATYSLLPGVMNPNPRLNASGPSDLIKGICYGNGIFVTISNAGTNRVWTTIDGINWQNPTSAAVVSWSGIAYGNGLFVAVSNSGGNVYTSTDAVTWTQSVSMDANIWTSVTYGNGLFVATASSGTNRIAYSYNGTTWTGVNVGSLFLQDVKFGGGVFLALGGGFGSPTLLRSTDGINWTSIGLPAASRAGHMNYGNGVWLATSRDRADQIYRSTNNGTSWTTLSLPGTNFGIPGSSNGPICYGNGMWMVSDWSSSRQIYYSLDDGLTFRRPINSAALTGATGWFIAFGNGLFVGGPSSGTAGVSMITGSLNQQTIPDANNLAGQWNVRQRLNIWNGANTLSVGPNTGTNTVYLGNGTMLSAATGAILVGSGNANSNNSIVIGSGSANSTLGSAGISIGSGAANGSSSIVLGSGSTSNSSAIVIGSGTADLASVVIGTNSPVGSSNVVAIGQGVNANAANVVAIGNFAISTATNAISIGNSASANIGSTASIVIGASATTSANPSSVAIGWGANTDFAGQINLCNARVASASDIATSILPLYTQTTDATLSELGLGAGSATTTPTNRIVCTNFSTYIFDVDIVARSVGSTGVACWNLKFAANRNANAASFTISSVSKNLLYTIGTVTGWDVNVTADTTNGRPNISVTGAGSTTINWVGHSKMTKVATAS